MPVRNERPLSIRDLARVIFRHKKKIVLWCGLVFVVAAAAFILIPRKYLSEARLFVRLGRESVSLDPTASTGQMVQVQETRENQINSARDMLQSRELMAVVVDKIGPEVILNGPAGEPPSGIMALVKRGLDALPSFELSPPISPAEKAIEKLSKALTVTVARNSSVISVAVKSKTPQLAQQILQEYLTAYQNQHLIANRTAGSQEFFGTQSKLIKQQLDTAVGQLRDAKNESGLVSIAVEQNALQTQLVQIEGLKLATDAALASADASMASLKNSLSELPKSLDSQQTSGFPNVAADNMRGELYKLQIQLRELEAKYTEEHPRVQAIRDQVRLSEEILDEQTNERTQFTKAVNPSRQAIELDLTREQALASSLRAKSTTVNEQYAQLQNRIKLLNEQEVRIAELERQVQLAESNYRTYANNFEQARIDNALETNRISNVNVVQLPSLIEQPASPQPLLIVVGAIVAAVGGSMCLAFGCEFLDQSLKTPEEVEERLSLPVLASIPRTRHDRLIFN